MFVGRSARSVRLLSALVAALALVLSGLVITSPSAATAATADCTPLTDADLAFGAPHLSGSLPEDSEGDCFTIAEPHGMQLSLGSMTEGIRVQVLSAPTEASPQGEVLCHVSSWKTCRLPASGPVSLQVYHYPGAATDYEVQAFEVGVDGGCPTQPTAAFGDDTAVAAVTIRSHEAACRVYDLSSGLHAVNQHYFGDWALFDDSGEAVCESLGDRCSVAQAGSYVLLFGFFRGAVGGSAVEQRLSVVDLSSAEGCGADVDLDWTAPTVRVEASTPEVMHCRTVPAEAGDRLVAGTRRLDNRNGVNSTLVDAAGEEVCLPKGGDIGCELTGAPPYRLLSQVKSNPGGFEFVVRSLEPGHGCPVVEPQPFGTAPDDVVPGSGCRRLVVEAAEPTPYIVQPIMDGGVPSEGATPDWIYDQDRQQPCMYFQHSECRLSTGQYWVIPDVFPTDLVTTVHDLRSSKGCVERATDLTPYELSLETGVYDCTVLPFAEGEVAAAVHVDDSSSWDHGTMIVGGDGQVLCDQFRSHTLLQCKLTGPPPYRAVVGGSRGTQEKLAFMDVSDTEHCAPFPGGGYDESATVDVSLTAERFVACLRVPPGDVHRKEMVRFQRTRGADTVSVHALNGAGGKYSEYAERGFVLGTSKPAGTGLAVVAVQLLEHGDNAYRFSRYGISSDAEGCRPVSSTTFGGPATGGALEDFLDATCYQVTADPGDRVWFDARDPDAEADLRVYDADGGYLCKTLVNQCVQSGHSTYQLVLQTRQDRPVDFDLDTWTLETKDGFAPECVRFDDYDDGFGPMEEILTRDRTGACVVLVAGDLWDEYDIDVANTEGGSVTPTPELVRYYTKYVYSCSTCRHISEGGPGESLLVLPLPEGHDRVPFRVTGTCAVGSSGELGGGCGRFFEISGATPMTAPSDTTATVTVQGNKLSGVDARLVRDGHDPVPGVPTVRDDRAPQFEFDLAGVEPGSWTLEVEDFWEGVLAVPGDFVVTEPHLGSVEQPQARGVSRVDRRLRAYEGTWSAEPDSFTYQWHVDGRDIGWATNRSLRLRPWMHAKDVSVTVTAYKHGYVDGVAATSGATLVLTGARPRMQERPRVKGIKRAGRWVRVTNGTWSKQPRRYSFRWFVDGKRLGRQTDRRLLLRRWMVGRRIQAKVIAHRPGCYDGRAWSYRYRVRR